MPISPKSKIGEKYICFRLAIKTLEQEDKTFIQLKYLPTKQDISHIQMTKWFQPMPSLEINILRQHFLI